MTIDGIINLNKPKGITSHGCVQVVRKLTGIRRVGHTGTLDPMAEGVLPVCVGNAVRITEYLDLDLKKYRCEMTLGLTTETQDVWGKVISDRQGDAAIPIDRVREAADSLVGLIDQTPPKYSAIRVGGKRLYEYARAGEEVEIKKRQVFIKDISINAEDSSGHKFSFDITCGKGTYVRTVCHDIGEKLGCGAAMSGLVRLASGAFKIEDAISPDELAELDEAGMLKVIKPADFPLVRFGRLAITSDERAEWFINGGYLRREEVNVESATEYKESYKVYADINGEDNFLGIATYDGEKEIFTPNKIFFRRN